MKNRSHRLPQSDSPDDWVDGSWTVDCSCGVTFDDGEEMVSCDECGVWVHTRCSRFVKGETSFACHNCKRNNNSNSSNSSKKPYSTAANTEETEVAQLLIELPTKTDPCPPQNPFSGPANRTPFRLWAEVPMEERVHVQGVPGGDPSLFEGISSSVFTSELWRCAGYVPKKFNFQYREFSCWEEDGGENPVSEGADVLFSLSKEIVPSCVPVRAFERNPEGGEKVLFGSRLQSWGKKERNKLRVFGSHSSKRREEDRSKKKKKARSDSDRVAAVFKKRGSFAVANVKKSGMSDGRDVQPPESDVAASKNEEGNEEEPSEEAVESGKKKARSDDEIVAEELERRVFVPVDQMKKAGVSEDVDVHITESDAPAMKIEERKEDGVSQKMDVPCVKSDGRKDDMPSQNSTCDQGERMYSDNKPKLVIKASNGGIADEKPRLKNASELHVKVETDDEATGISSEADVPAASQEKWDENVKQHVKEEHFVKAVDGLKQPKDESHFQGDPNSSAQAKMVSPGSCQNNAKMNQPVAQKQMKFLNRSMSLHPPSSAGAATILSDREDIIKAVPGLEQAKDENHLQCDATGSTQAKPVSSGSSQKNEKTNQSVPQPLSKLRKHSISTHPPSSASPDNTINDQKIALRLHQELNSSPRVPRVPRIRQASVLLTSQSAPSMLSKRSSHSGGRDQAFRRKNKEGASRDGSHNSQKTIDESKRAGRAMSSPDHKHRESYLKTGGSAKKDSRNESPDTIVSMKKSRASIGGDSCRPSFEGSGQSALSIKYSPRNVPDDDTPRTLPGLIDEILSKQKCSTYEELCDAVRLHWQNVRKPNGERYAYSSHSHAVLDCLRNRSEWAHLIDRGPKTNSSKRRRKIDSDTPTVEELETADARNKASSRELEDKNGDLHREDFPKGKRKARKRRRLELHGRSMEEARKRKCASSSGSAIVSDDDDNDDDESAATYSHSSNEGADEISSEEESQEAIDHSGVGASGSTSPDASG